MRGTGELRFVTPNTAAEQSLRTSTDLRAKKGAHVATALVVAKSSRKGIDRSPLSSRAAASSAADH